MDRVADVERDLLAKLPFGVQVAATRDQGVAKSGLGGPVLDGKVQRQREPVRRISKAEQLVQRVAESSCRNQLRRSNTEIVLIASQSVTGVVSAQAQIRQ